MVFSNVLPEPENFDAETMSFAPKFSRVQQDRVTVE
jgi:hypothetical protein